MARSILRPSLLAYGWALLSLLAAALRAEEAVAVGFIEVRSAYVEPLDGIYFLTAQLAFALPEDARQALRDGVTLRLDIEVELNRARRFWPDARIASLRQQYQLTFHALSMRYVVRNLNSGDQLSFASLEAALESLRTIRAVPILDASLLRPGQSYECSLRATLDVRTLPEALRWVLFWIDDWRQRSEWYTWSLPR